MAAKMATKLLQMAIICLLFTFIVMILVSTFMFWCQRTQFDQNKSYLPTKLCQSKMAAKMATKLLQMPLTHLLFTAELLFWCLLHKN